MFVIMLIRSDTMLEFRKVIVLLFVTLLLLYTLRFQLLENKKWQFKTSTFIILMIGLFLAEAATFLDVLANYIRTTNVHIIIKVLFTCSIIFYTIGLILWTRFTQKMMTKLELLSHTDPMTGVLNRTGIEKVYENLSKYNSHFCLILCDLDGTKKLNDTMGHIEGDKFICYSSKTIVDAIGSNGYLSRIGGDEFVVILKDFTIPQLEGIISNIKIKIHEKYGEHNAGISLGYSFCPRDGSTLEELIIIADKKMYMDKTTHKYLNYSLNL
jgi:diguanylate cyclase (GGDEF)-like protein